MQCRVPCPRFVFHIHFQVLATCKISQQRKRFLVCCPFFLLLLASGISLFTCTTCRIIHLIWVYKTWQKPLSVITFNVATPKCLSWIWTRFKSVPKVNRDTTVTPFCLVFAYSVYLLSSTDGLEFFTFLFILLKRCIYVATPRLCVKPSPSDWFQDYSSDIFLKLSLGSKYY